jgi:2-dehydro-3-deoxygluconokinase
MAQTVKAKQSCRWDLVSLGEVMLRFDPGDHRIWTTRRFEVSEGGGEYNVARPQTLFRTGYGGGHLDRR